MNCSTSGLPIHHHLLEFTQTHVHRVGITIQPSHPLLSPSPPAPQSLLVSESFPMSQLFAWGGQSIRISALAVRHDWATDLIWSDLLLGRKVMTSLDSIFKSRDITLSTKVLLVKAMVFPVVMYGYESWTIKKAEHQRIDAFETYWRRFLRVPWTARISNHSILKKIRPEYSLEGLMLKLKLQYFGHLMRRAYLLEKTMMLGKIEGGRRRG